MQRCIKVALCLTVFLAAGFASVVVGQQIQGGGGSLSGSSADYYQALKSVMAGDWQQYGQLFTTMQSQWFEKIFLWIVVAVPGLYILHYLIVGAKRFDHDGPQVYFFPMFVRIVHFLAAVTFTLLVITGLMMVFGAYLGGGSLVRTARYVHLGSAMAFAVPGILMLLMWLKDMLPKLHDITWFFICGGYLSKEKKPVPAAKFNGGQKTYFWFATLGGAVMGFSGYMLWSMSGAVDNVRLYAMIHNILGMVIVALYLTHIYMVVFAVAGSLSSMKTGYKPKEEVDILHSLYKYE